MKKRFGSIPFSKHASKRDFDKNCGTPDVVAVGAEANHEIKDDGYLAVNNEHGRGQACIDEGCAR